MYVKWYYTRLFMGTILHKQRACVPLTTVTKKKLTTAPTAHLLLTQSVIFRRTITAKDSDSVQSTGWQVWQVSSHRDQNHTETCAYRLYLATACYTVAKKEAVLPLVAEKRSIGLLCLPFALKKAKCPIFDWCCFGSTESAHKQCYMTHTVSTSHCTALICIKFSWLNHQYKRLH